jgi:hypothetical protein
MMKEETSRARSESFSRLEAAVGVEESSKAQQGVKRGREGVA